MENFFKQFRDRLEDRPTPNFEPQDWQQLQQRLAVLSVGGGSWVWAALPVLLLLATNAGWWYATTQTVPTGAESVAVPDTIYRVQTVYRTDTVYRTQVVSLPASLQISAGLPGALRTTSLTDVQTHGGLFARKRLKYAKPPFATASGETISEGEQAISNQQPPHLSLVASAGPYGGRWELPTGQAPFEAPTEVVPQRRKRGQRYLPHVGWRDIEFGVLGGTGRVFGTDAKTSYGPMVGAQASAEILPHLRVWVGSTYSRSRIDVLSLSEENGIPTITPPSDNLIFEKAEVPQPEIHYTLGLQYRFQSLDRWEPFLGVGYGIIQSLPYEFIYEFTDPTTEIEWQFEGHGGAEAAASTLTTQAGVAYRLAQRWQWQLQMTHRTATPRSSQAVGIQGGLYFLFK